jgi:hypothetical protein
VTLKIPQTITEDQNAWFFKPNWSRMHNRKQQYNAIFTGQCGTGKSYATLYIGKLLDRSTKDDSRFSIENVAFSAEEFTRITNKNHPVGTAVIIDDAAFSAYSKDAMTKEVKNVSKIFISQRHLRRCILLSVPSMDMITKNVLQTIQYYNEMQGINYQAETSYAKTRKIQMNPMTGKIYFRKLIFFKKHRHKTHNLSMQKTLERPYLRFKMPEKELVKEYEKARREATAIHYEEAERQLKEKRLRNEKRTLVDDFNFVKGNVEQFLDSKKKVDAGKIMLANISEYRARKISKMLNDEREVNGVCNVS